MDVRFGDVRDAQVFVFGGAEVLVDVAIGIDDDGLAGGLTAEKEAGLGELGVVEAREEHSLGRMNTQNVSSLGAIWTMGIMISCWAAGATPGRRRIASPLAFVRRH